MLKENNYTLTDLTIKQQLLITGQRLKGVGWRVEYNFSSGVYATSLFLIHVKIILRKILHEIMDFSWLFFF